MAFRKRMYRKRPYAGRRRARTQPWYSKKYSVGDIASKAWRTAKYLKSLINVEHQKIDFNATSAPDSSAAGITHVTAVPVGDSEGTRTGNSILAKYYYLKFYSSINTSANFTRIRVVLVRDKQQIADTAPGFTDIYESLSTTSLLNKLTVGRFDILMDKLVVLDSQRPTSHWEKYFPLNSHVRYNGTASTDQQKGALYLMLLSDQSTNTPTVRVDSRLMYIDN